MNNQTSIIAEPGKQELFITREFEAPRELVFRAFTEPELLLQWLGPKDLTMKMEKNECWSGGSWRFLHCRGNNNYGFHGVMHEVTAPERIIRTFEFEGLPESGHVSLETATFQALEGGRTLMQIHSIFQSVADRDGMVQAGMERGVADSHAKLVELLEKMKQQN